MSEHMIKTTNEWNSTSMMNKIIERGCLCIEISDRDVFAVKIGDGKRTYQDLPYLFEEAFESLQKEIELLNELILNKSKERYTKEEIDTIANELKEQIQKIDLSNYITTESLEEYTQPFTSEEKEKLASLENVDLSEYDDRITVLEENQMSMDSIFEYLDEKTSNPDADISLPDFDLYATKEYVDEQIQVVEPLTQDSDWITPLISNITSSDIEYRKIINGLVEICGTFTPNKSANELTLFTLPEEYRPHKDHIFAQISMDDQMPFALQITTAGVVSVIYPEPVNFDTFSKYTIEAMFLV